MKQYKHKTLLNDYPSKEMVLIFPEFWGVTEFIGQVDQRLSKLGYNRLIIDLFGNNIRPKDPQEASKLFDELVANPSPLIESLRTLLFELSQSGITLNAISFSAGNIVMLETQKKLASTEFTFRKMISCYGRMPQNFPNLPGHYLVLNGELDVSTQSLDFDAIASFFNKGCARTVHYKDSKHMFMNPLADKIAEQFNRPVGYNPETCNAAWEEINLFLNR